MKYLKKADKTGVNTKYKLSGLSIGTIIILTVWILAAIGCLIWRIIALINEQSNLNMGIVIGIGILLAAGFAELVILIKSIKKEKKMLITNTQRDSLPPTLQEKLKKEGK